MTEQSTNAVEMLLTAGEIIDTATARATADSTTTTRTATIKKQYNKTMQELNKLLKLIG